MKLPKISIENYQFTLMVFAALFIAGLYSYFTMPRTENPDIVMPGVSVIVIYPGASPVDLEELVAIPIEEAVNELDDIKRINSSIVDGVVFITVEFDFDVNADKKYDDVVQKVNSIRSDLPPDILDLKMVQWSSSDIAMLQLALVSEKASYAELEDHAETLKKDIERVSGVKKVEIVACPAREVRISLDLEKMALMNIPIDQVVNSILSSNANIPGGSIKLGSKVYSIKTSGSYEDLEQIRRTVISSYMGRLIYLENIAQVEFDYEDVNYVARFPLVRNGMRTGEKAIFITISQKEGLNVLKIAREVKEKITEYQRNLVNGIRLEYAFDQTEGVKSRISSFMGNIWQGIFLVGLIILLILGLRSSLVVIIAIPLSIFIGLGIVDRMGYGLQQISIAGLIIALGMLVDNSIVMVENITRHMYLGLKPRKASVTGASEIGWAIVSSTVTTVLAFIPLALMPHEAGLFIRSLPVTIIVTLLVSLIIALSLNPLITAVFFTKKKTKVGKEQPTIMRKYLQKFIEGPYRRTIRYSLGHSIRVLLIAIGVLGLSLFMFRFVGLSLFPKAEHPGFMIRIRLPEGVNLDKTAAVAGYVESVLDTIPEIRSYATNIGHGNPRIYYNALSETYKTHFAEVYVATHEYDPDEFDILVNKLRELFAGYPGAKITIKEFEQGHPIAAPIQIYLTGKNLDKLSSISHEFENHLIQQDGVINVVNELTKNKTEIYFKINRDKANMFGVPIHVIDKTIRTALTGIAISKYRDKDGKDYNITVRLPIEEKTNLSDIDKINVTSLSGKTIPLRQVAKIEFRQSPSIINRYNMDRTAEIRADLIKGYVIDDVMEPVLSKLESYPFPSGYGYHIGGELESRSDTFSGLNYAIILALIAVFAVLVLQFKSFVQPLIVFIAIPFAIIGAIWALLITGNTFSFTAAVGFTSLVGIVVNNSILMVDYINLLRKNGTPLNIALQTAGETRFTPIFLTSTTTILGLLPLTLRGGTLWAPMGWTIIGGLLISTALTLIMVPVLYRLFVREKP